MTLKNWAWGTVLKEYCYGIFWIFLSFQKVKKANKIMLLYIQTYTIS